MGAGRRITALPREGGAISQANRIGRLSYAAHDTLGLLEKGQPLRRVFELIGVGRLGSGPIFALPPLVLKGKLHSVDSLSVSTTYSMFYEGSFASG